MSNNIESEILRLVKEISEDEEKLVDAERYTYTSGKAEKYRNAIERKLRLLEILKK